MTFKKIPGTQENPLILNPLIKEDSAFSKHHGGLNPDKISDLHDKPSIKKYVHNLLSNRYLSEYSKEIGIWLRLNLDGYENIISMHEVRAKQRFPNIGELVKAEPVEDNNCGFNIPSEYMEAVKVCRELINESEVSLYQYLMNHFKKSELNLLVDVFYKDKIPQFSSERFKKHKYAEWLVKFFQRESLYSDARNFAEIANLYWSRSDLFNFAIEVLDMDDEEMHYLMYSSFEEMVDFISDFYFESNIHGENHDKDFWAIYFKRDGSKNKQNFYLCFPPCKGKIPKFIQAKKIHEEIYRDGYDPLKFYNSLLELESFGYLRLSPLNKTENDGLVKDLFHPFPKRAIDKNKTELESVAASDSICYYYHLQFNSLISMRDYSLYWNAISRDVERELKIKKK